MPDNVQIDQIAPLRGLVTAITPTRLEPGDAAVADFVDVDFGIIECAAGRKQIGTVSGPITTIFEFIRDNGERVLFIATTTHLYKVLFPGPTFTELSSGIGGDPRAFSWTYNPILDILILTNSLPNPLIWDGSIPGIFSLALPAGVTTVDFVLWFKNRLLLFGVTESGIYRPYRMWWSQLGIYNAWNTNLGAGVIDISNPTGPFQNVKVFADRIIAFRDHAVNIIYYTGSPLVPFSWEVRHDIPGTQAPFSLAEGDEGIFYLSSDGVRVTDGQSSVLLTNHVDDLLNLPYLQVKNASAEVDTQFKRYVVVVASFQEGNNDISWVVSYRTWPQQKAEVTRRTWVGGTPVRSIGKALRTENLRWIDFGATEAWQTQIMQWISPQVSGNFIELFSGGYSGQFWIHEGATNDLGQYIPMKWETGIIPPGRPRELIRLLWVALSGVPSVNTQIDMEIIDADNEETIFSVNMDMSTRRVLRVPVNRSLLGGFRIRLSNINDNSVPLIDGIEYAYIPGPSGRSPQVTPEATPSF